MPWRYILRLRSFTSRCGLQVERLIGFESIWRCFYSSTWFFVAFPSISHRKSPPGKVTDLPQMQRYLKSPARYPFPKGNVGWDLCGWENCLAIQGYPRRCLCNSTGIVLVVFLGSEKCSSQTTDCSDCPEFQGLVYVQNVDTVLNRRRWRHRSTCGFSTQRKPGKIPQHSFWWNEWTEPNLLCIEAGGFHYWVGSHLLWEWLTSNGIYIQWDFDLCGRAIPCGYLVFVHLRCRGM